ncbi:hypothetical protein [Acidithiobacillus acidisediminis]|uniref:hypothetical protein n=1 Tax=Acidithiobacillus TaxID=119977 RepID=UPI00200CC0DA|nr:hypothetical protein [Acidithiobacillus sp. S30A2]
MSVKRVHQALSENDYMLADAEQVEARLFSREGDGWRAQTLDREDRILLDCGGLSLPLSLDALYEDTGLL